MDGSLWRRLTWDLYRRSSSWPSWRAERALRPSLSWLPGVRGAWIQARESTHFAQIPIYLVFTRLGSQDTRLDLHCHFLELRIDTPLSLSHCPKESFFLLLFNPPYRPITANPLKIPRFLVGRQWSTDAVSVMFRGVCLATQSQSNCSKCTIVDKLEISHLPILFAHSVNSVCYTST